MKGQNRLHRVWRRLGGLAAALALALSLAPAALGATARASNLPTAQNEDALVFEDDRLVGLRADWLEQQPGFGGEQPLSVRLVVPDNTVEIAADAFSTQVDALNVTVLPAAQQTAVADPSAYRLAQVDFSSAEDLTYIGERAFYGQDALTSLALPQNLQTIDAYAFAGCTALASVQLPDGLRALGSEEAGGVFQNCAALASVRPVTGNARSARAEATGSLRLPSGLEVLGADTFAGAMTAATPAPLTLADSVRYVGARAFQTPAVNTILVEARQPEKYDAAAFDAAGGAYGPGARLTVFDDQTAWQRFVAGAAGAAADTGALDTQDTQNGSLDATNTQNGSLDAQNDGQNTEGGDSATDAATRAPRVQNAEEKGLTYPIQVSFMDASGVLLGTVQQKLHAQRLDSVQAADKSWVTDPKYTLPSANFAPTPAAGYAVGFDAGGVPLAATTRLQGDQNGRLTFTLTDTLPAAPQLQLQVTAADGSQTLRPITQPLVLAEGQQYTVTAHLTQPLSEKNLVRFDCVWTDVRAQDDRNDPALGGHMVEGDTITISGADDARGGQDYYLLEVYGYYIDPDGSEKLYYKTCNPTLADDAQRTLNTSYGCQVSFSAPATTPQVALQDNVSSVAYDYGQTAPVITAELTQAEGHTYSYQWYSAEGQRTTDGTPVEGATTATLTLPSTLEIGTHHYYLETTATKQDNQDTATTVTPVTVTVNRAANALQLSGLAGLAYTGQPVSPNITQSGDAPLTLVWYSRQADGQLQVLDEAPTASGNYRLLVQAAETPHYLAAAAQQDFSIRSVDNSWQQQPGIRSWRYGETPSQPLGTAAFGQVTYTYSSSEKGPFVGTVPTTVGQWYLRVAVPGTADYSALESVTPFTIAKADPPPLPLPGTLTAAPNSRLSAVTLPEGWRWVQPTRTVETSVDSYAARYPVDDANYDYSAVQGYLPDDHCVERMLPVSVLLPAASSSSTVSSASSQPQQSAAGSASNSNTTAQSPSQPTDQIGEATPPLNGPNAATPPTSGQNTVDEWTQPVTPATTNSPKGWALMDLVCAALTMLLGLVTVLLHGDDEEEEDSDSHAISIKVLGAVVALLALGLCVFTQNFAGERKLVDLWTPVLAILAVINGGALGLAISQLHAAREKAAQEPGVWKNGRY